MIEQERDHDAQHADEHDRRAASRGQITGLTDLLPDWILPAEGKQHVRNARKEMLLAARSVLDAAIARQEAGPKPRRAPSRVEIE